MSLLLETEITVHSSNMKGNKNDDKVVCYQFISWLLGQNSKNPPDASFPLELACPILAHGRGCGSRYTRGKGPLGTTIARKMKMSDEVDWSTELCFNKEKIIHEKSSIPYLRFVWYSFLETGRWNRFETVMKIYLEAKYL